MKRARLRYFISILRAATRSRTRWDTKTSWTLQPPSLKIRARSASRVAMWLTKQTKDCTTIESITDQSARIQLHNLLLTPLIIASLGPIHPSWSNLHRLAVTHLLDCSRNSPKPSLSTPSKLSNSRSLKLLMPNLMMVISSLRHSWLMPATMQSFKIWSELRRIIRNMPDRMSS